MAAVAEDLGKYDVTMDHLQKYIDAKVTLDNGRAKMGINTKVKFDRVTNAAMEYGALGMLGALASQYGLRMGVRAAAVATFGFVGFTVMGAGLGGWRGADRAKVNEANYDINEALGRDRLNDETAIGGEVEGLKAKAKQQLARYNNWKKRLRKKNGLVSRTEGERVFATDATAKLKEALAMEDGKLVTDPETGKLKWNDEYSTAEKQAEFMEYVAGLRAKMNYGAETGVDYVAFDVPKDAGLTSAETMTEIEGQRTQLAMAMGDAMRLLRERGMTEQESATEYAVRDELKAKAEEVQTERGKLERRTIAAGAIKGAFLGTFFAGVRNVVAAVRAGGLAGAAGGEQAIVAGGVVDENAAGETAGDAAGNAADDAADAAEKATEAGKYFAKAAKMQGTEIVAGKDGGYDMYVDTDGDGKLENVLHLDDNAFNADGTLSDKAWDDIHEIRLENGNPLFEEGVSKEIAETDFELSGYERYSSVDIANYEVPAGHEGEAGWVLEEFHRSGWDGSRGVDMGQWSFDKNAGEYVLNVSSQNGDSLDGVEYVMSPTDGSSQVFKFAVENGQVRIPEDSTAGASLFQLNADTGQPEVLAKFGELAQENGDGTAVVLQTSTYDVSGEGITSLQVAETIPELKKTVLYGYTENGVRTESFEIKPPASLYGGEAGLRSDAANYMTAGNADVFQTDEAAELANGDSVYVERISGGVDMEHNNFYSDLKTGSNHNMSPLTLDDKGEQITEIDPNNLENTDTTTLIQNYIHRAVGTAQGSEMTGRMTGYYDDGELNSTARLNEVANQLVQDRDAFDTHNGGAMEHFVKNFLQGKTVKAERVDTAWRSSEYGYESGDGYWRVEMSNHMANRGDEVLLRFYDTDENGNLVDAIQDTPELRELYQVPANAINVRYGLNPNCGQWTAEYDLPRVRRAVNTIVQRGQETTVVERPTDNTTPEVVDDTQPNIPKPNKPDVPTGTGETPGPGPAPQDTPSGGGGGGSTPTDDVPTDDIPTDDVTPSDNTPEVDLGKNTEAAIRAQQDGHVTVRGTDNDLTEEPEYIETPIEQSTLDTTEPDLAAGDADNSFSEVVLDETDQAAQNAQDAADAGVEAATEAAEEAASASDADLAARVAEDIAEHNGEGGE